jgi:hypothetical protein
LQNVPYLSTDELGALRQRERQGPAGQLEIAGQLAHSFGAAVASEIAYQVDPNDKDLALMVKLHPRVADLYLKGVTSLADHTVKLGVDQADNDAIAAQFDPYRAGIPDDMQGAVLNAARNITAGTAKEFGRGQPTGDELTGAFRESIQRAGGMLGSPGEGSATGGFVNWNGRYAWLPPTMRRDDFQKRLSRAGPAEWSKAAGGEPYYMGGDGKLTKMSEGQVKRLGQYQLETVSPGVYRLVGSDGGHVVNKDRQPFQFDVRNLP